jgi:large conductance mechanosensitive channel
MRARSWSFVVKPVNVLTSRMRLRQSPDPSTRKCPECLSEIPVAARRCAFCAIEVPVGSDAGTGAAA